MTFLAVLFVVVTMTHVERKFLSRINQEQNFNDQNSDDPELIINDKNSSFMEQSIMNHDLTDIEQNFKLCDELDHIIKSSIKDHNTSMDETMEDLKSTDPQQIIMDEINILQNMNCTPKYKKISVRVRMNSKDPKKFGDLYPEVLGVLRCDNKSSYCGGCSGEDWKKCRPHQTEWKDFTVKYKDNNGDITFFNVKAKQHLSCTCQ